MIIKCTDLDSLAFEIRISGIVKRIKVTTYFGYETHK